MTALQSFFAKVTQVKPEETRGAILSFFFIFILMASYMILKPARDALPSEWGDVSRATQWTFTFIASLICVFIYDWVASKISLKTLVPGVFVFFSLSFLAIYVSFQSGVSTAILGKVFYIWTSVFSLFHISVFWSFISQHYSTNDSKRLFSIINTGASAGAICGPLLVIKLAEKMSIEHVLVIASISLLICLPLIHLLNKHFSQKQNELPEREQKTKLKANPFSGFKELINDKTLGALAVFILLFTGVSTFFYTTQSDLLVDYTRAERRELLGSVEFITNALTIFVGLFATGRILKKFGVATSLAVVPFAVAALMLILCVHPTTLFILALVVVRRVGNYSITKPAREVVFTSVDQEARFKTKPFIDVAVYRGGDVLWIWVIAFLGDGYLNLGLTSKIIAAIVISIIWGCVGIYLGKRCR